MGLFTKNLYSKKQIGYGRKTSKAMKDLLKKQGISKILDKRSEQDEFYNALKEKASGGITKNEMREVLGHFRYDHGKNIDEHEAERLARIIMPTGKRYIIEKPKNNSPLPK